jgi:hypothetical protein
MEKYFNFIQENYPKEAKYFYVTEYAKLKDIQENISKETLFIECLY